MLFPSRLRCLQKNHLLAAHQIVFHSPQKTPFHWTAVNLKRMPPTKLNDEERLEKLDPILASGWSMVEGRDAIYRELIFKDFNEAFGFMARVALKAERMDHHPEWSNVWNRVEVTLTTHDAGGVTALDVEMAGFMDTVAAELGVR